MVAIASSVADMAENWGRLGFGWKRGVVGVGGGGERGREMGGDDGGGEVGFYIGGGEERWWNGES